MGHLLFCCIHVERLWKKVLRWLGVDFSYEMMVAIDDDIAPGFCFLDALSCRLDGVIKPSFFLSYGY